MIYVFLADGFEEVEALTPIDYLRRCELDVKSVGIRGKIVRGAHGISVIADITVEDVDLSNAEMLVLPGGMPGTLNLEKSDFVLNAIDYAVKNDIKIGAICAAPSILGHKGLLKGKNAVCFEGYEDELVGANIIDSPTVTDNLIITARSASAANEFSFALAESLCGQSRASKLKEALLWQK